MTTLKHLEQHPGTDPEPFSSVVTSIEDEYIVMDCTAFYPMGGGQPGDKGQIKSDSFSCTVVDVRKEDEVRHLISDTQGILNPGDQIHCSIDTGWRNQLSAMHTAQHLVSALANEEWGAHTVGNQIGCDRTRIDLLFENRDVFDRDLLMEMVNDAISKDMEVSMDFRPSAELLEDPLVRVNMDRMPPNIDIWRTISIGELDVCPCAGTHVLRTGQIPEVEITRVKSKGAGRLRIEYILNK
ncbi:MAG: alanyl-tRNA editing protein [Candidatus Thermoplasmatota archaeon]|nr:alanyl-tRNA editing protein [Candidatus Thermoplasmatota archaeon]